VEGETEDGYDESCIYSSSSGYRNHAPFSSSMPRHHSFSSLQAQSVISPIMPPRHHSNPSLRAQSPINNENNNNQNESNYNNYYTTRDGRSPDPSKNGCKYQNSLINESINDALLSIAQTAPCTRSNRPRASTFSAISSISKANDCLNVEAERTPMGLITWLASLEDDDFVAAKLLAELGTNEKNEDNMQYEIDSIRKDKPCDIPKFRGSRNKDNNTQKEMKIEGQENITRRRRRANSVIEVRVKSESLLDEDGMLNANNNILGGCGRNPRTYRKGMYTYVELVYECAYICIYMAYSLFDYHQFAIFMSYHSRIYRENLFNETSSLFAYL
jgi:hypothetical protein